MTKANGTLDLNAWTEVISKWQGGIKQPKFCLRGDLNAAYTPAASIFAGTQPTTIKQAFDRIGSVLVGLATKLA